MDRRDQELLNKQLRRIVPPPRNDGVLMLTVTAIFIAGVTLGSTLFANEGESPPQQTASIAATSHYPLP
ncbi:MAG: hypothetical protein KGK33_07285 [Hyphomicrobiales bacterium]|jgi:hypothetical protein|nr:hypothetical protein [Hyphomicrobiales bacterium]MDE1973386.1 hypothetical protein [Hyphomicrobiales bacterium]MDE2284400.1 hypothetical protein [Hyphomicrobiales bacterium]